jgi:AraC-like DNA-binding protein
MLVHFTPLYMLAGPALYFYVRGVLTDDYRLKKMDLIHFLPAVIYFINVAGYIFSSMEYKMQFAKLVMVNPIELSNLPTLFISGKINFIVRPISGIIYAIASAVLVIRHHAGYKLVQKQSNLMYKWLWFLILTVLTIYICFLFFSWIGIQVLNFEVASATGKYLLITVVIGLILLNCSLMFFHNILYGLPQLDYAIQLPAQRTEITSEEAIKRNARNFEISDEKLQLLKYKIDKYVLGKPYINPEFNLSFMSLETDIPVHHLSYYFNVHLNMHFNTWKNELKVAHVLDLIHHGSGELLTLDALSKQAGFGSRTSFFNAFKQKMGLTPSEYLNKMA